ncbi:MAG TPA: NAD-dependent epimerase/dehydratase family protein [Chloroflexota bacterium]|nr:NAD-dependent epimerase/dehydratase family protein [Chloroflexota bacterium]
MPGNPIDDKVGSAYEAQRILITGGLGFIGSNLARRLVALGAKVTLVDSLIPDYGGNLFNIHGIEDQVRVNVADVRDPYSMNYLIKDQAFLFNLAGTLSHIDSMTDPFTDLEINCRSQLSILESCKNHNRDVRIVFSGTRGQYGRAQQLPVDEGHPMRPTDVNGINNIAGESYHLLYSDVYGINATSLRLTNTYGPRHQMHHHRQGIINWFVRQAIDGDTIKIYGDGTQVRDTNYIDDVVDALLLTGARRDLPGEVFNLGGDPVSLIDLAKVITARTGTDFTLIPFPESAKSIEIGDYVANWSKAKRELGWSPRTSLDEGMDRTIEYYRENKSHYW